jgi:PilZ domain
MRKETRQPVSRPGRIETEDGNTLPCRIADISKGGALLLIPDGEWLPKQFVLVDVFQGTRRQVRVRWAAPDKVGVAFIGDDAPARKKPTGFGKRR